MKVLIAVTHLLGIGHLSRMIVLAQAFATQGHKVVLMSGGLPAPHLMPARWGSAPSFTLAQLPPVVVHGTNYAQLFTPQGARADEAYFAGRRQRAVQLLTEYAPDVVITELFPFGRRRLAHEFMALLETAAQMRPRPLLLSSVRDILEPPPRVLKVQQCESILADWYDGILVHADRRFITLGASWPMSPRIEAKLHYTGFVAPPPPEQAPPRAEAWAEKDTVLVSAGGGAVGQVLFTTALEGAAHSARPWQLLVGGSNAEAQIARLRALAPANARIRPLRRDFRTLLLHAAALVSMCGYNTTMDILQTGVPAVLMPFDEKGEKEQSLRGESLARLAGIVVMAAGTTGGAALASAVERVIAGGRRGSVDFNFDGARSAVASVERLRAHP